jgi:muramidase (phage lysozyme)
MPGKPSISGSVGRGGKNAESDVRTVQNLINDNLPTPLRPLEINGKCDQFTIGAIEEIQRRSLHLHAPDGRVDPQGATFRFLVKGEQNLSAFISAQQLVADPRIKAMLDVLGFTEGTGTDYGKVADGLVLKSPNFPELVGKRDVSVKDFKQHPDILVQWAPNTTTTAAGRYQFLKGTWDGLGMPDFTPHSQDIAAVKLMQRRGMIEPLLAGDIDTAVHKGAPEWASLPIVSGGSYYGGQTARTIVEIRKFYNAALQKYPPVCVAGQ